MSSPINLPLVLGNPVDAALHYADYARQANADHDVWRSNHPALSAGDKVIGLQETETRPHRCMQILAAEVRRLRKEVAS